MELKTTHEVLRKPIIGGFLLGSVALGLTGCASGSYEIEASNPMTILDKQQSQRFVSEQESPAYPHYEDVYTLVVKQCDREELEITDDDGCVDLSVKVSEQTFASFSEGDSIVFNEPLRGYPVSAKG